MAPDERLVAAGGQVRLVRAGGFCLACVDGIDRTRAAQDLMSTPARQRQVARGHAQGVDLPTPAVLFLNAEVASLAMAEFVNLWTGRARSGQGGRVGIGGSIATSCILTFRQWKSWVPRNMIPGVR